MFLLSKIIAKAWFKSLIGCLVVLFLLITVGDVINGYLRGWDTTRVFTEYVLKLPFLAAKLLPICALLSTLFSVNSLKTHSELIALLSSGYSAKKIYKLILVFSLSVAFLQFINVGFMQPMANKVKNNLSEKVRPITLSIWPEVRSATPVLFGTSHKATLAPSLFMIEKIKNLKI